MSLELENKLQEGLAYCNERAWAAAAAAFEAALLLDSQCMMAWNNLGNVRDELGDALGAMTAYQAALHIHPDYISAKTNLGIVAHKRGTAVYELGDLAEALRCFEIASHTAASTGQGNAAGNADYDHSYLQLLLETCAHDSVNGQVALMQARFEAQQNYRLHPYPLLAAVDAPLWHLHAAKRYADVLRAEASADVVLPTSLQAASNLKTTPNARIRIAYLSSDWHQHPVPEQLLPSIEWHDKSKFEVVGIATDVVPDTTPWRRRIESAFDHFYALGDLSDSAIADQLRSMNVDIAIDLSLYMQNGRPLILASRPCRLQVAFLGYAGTSGAPWIDYLITDEVVSPSTHEAFYSERLIRLAGGSFMPDHNQRPRAVAQPDKVQSRRMQGLPAEGFVFCAFSNPYKITPSLLTLWFELLHQVPSSVLWLQANNELTQCHISQAAAQAGLAPSRLVFAKRVGSFAEHVQRYTLADLFLDTYPYNAHVTAADALWAGLPVLTLQGESFASRVASSILTAVGVPELMTTSYTDYQKLAYNLATQPTYLRAVTQRIANGKEQSDYFNPERYVRRLEAALLAMAT